MNTAQIILSQLNALDCRALFAWGAKDLMNMGDGLKFKTSGMCKWKGYVYIRYNGAKDLYEIQFFRFRKNDVKYDAMVYDVFAEDLVAVIDKQVG